MKTQPLSNNPAVRPPSSNEESAGQKSVPMDLLPLACLVFAVWNVWAIFSYRCLYADGAHEFIRTLEAQGFFSLSWHRQFAYYIVELPLVAMMKLGVVDMNWLRLAFGFGCYLLWPVVMLFCFWISPRNFWIVVLACAAGYLNAAFMAIGEHIVAHACFWPVLFVVLYARPLKPAAALGMLASAACLLFSYESQFFLGLVLAALAAWRMVEESKAPAASPRWSQMALLLTVCICLAASAIGLHALVRPDNPAEFAGFRTQTIALLLQPGWTLTWTAFWLYLMVWAFFSGQAWRFLSSRKVQIILPAVVMLWGLWPLLAPESFDPAGQFRHRALNLMVPFALLPVALIARYQPRWLTDRCGRMSQMAAVLLLAQSLWHISATSLWQRDIGKMQALLATCHGVIPIHATLLATSSLENSSRDFDWSMPCLSIAINPGRQIQSLVCGEPYVGPGRSALWQPFDPVNPAALPNLQHFGLSYSNYIIALPRQTGP